MADKLKEFLTRHHACSEVLDRLAATGAKTLEEAWERADARDLVWAVTRPGVMSSEQRRLFLVMVLSSIEDKLTDPRSRNILTKLRTKETITDDDREAAACSAEAAEADSAAAWADSAAAWAAWAAESAAGAEAEEAEAWAAWAAAIAAASAAWAAWAAQAKWVRENFKLCDLNTK